MGLDVELIRRLAAGLSPRGHRDVELATVGDVHFRFAEAVERGQQDESMSVLDRIDLHGVAELESDEMPQFLSELDHLLTKAADPAERKVVEAVRSLAERCRHDRQLALRLVGD